MIFLSPPEDFAPRMNASGCFVEAEGRILLLHRQPWKPDGNTWCVPGGKHEPGETPLEAMIRELREETGIDLAERPPEHLFHTFARLTSFDTEYHIFRAVLPALPSVALETAAHQAFVWVTPEEALGMNLIEDEDACIKLCYDVSVPF